MELSSIPLNVIEHIYVEKYTIKVKIIHQTHSKLRHHSDCVSVLN